MLNLYSRFLYKTYSKSTYLIKKSQPLRCVFAQGNSYEGEGKTTVTILNRDADYGIMIDALSPVGFKLNIGINILGAMILFPRSVIGWNISDVSDINEKSLSLFKLLIPRPDILILGLDDNYPRNAPFLIDFQRIIKSLNISIEVLPVDKACTTFNFLNAERRYVVGAFLPPKKIDEPTMREKLQAISVRRALHEPSLKEMIMKDEAKKKIE